MLEITEMSISKTKMGKELCISQTKEILAIAKKLRSEVFDKKDLTPEEWESHYQELVRVNGDLHEAFYAIFPEKAKML